MDLPKILLTGLFFLFFFGFLRVFGQLGLGTPKNLEKNDENQKKQKKTIWNRLTPDSSHRIVFFVSFWFSLTFWTYNGKVEMKKGKNMKKQKMQKPNAASVPFCFFFGRQLVLLNFWENELFRSTLPETNSFSPLKIGLLLKKETSILFQPSIFRCENLSFREATLFF